MGRMAIGVLLPLAVLGLLVSPALAGHHKDGQHHKKQIKILVTPDGEDSDEVIFDASDLEVGETRYLTSESGKEVAITREENGFRIDIDGDETFVMTPDKGMHKRIMVHSAAGAEATANAFVVSGEGEGEGHEMVWVSEESGEVHLGGLEDTVFISGAGDLDEYDRERIIDALRDAGIDKEIRFVPSGGSHGFHFVTTSKVDGEGGDLELKLQKLIPGEDDADVVVIEKKLKKEIEEDE
jgi:hypothetical protein